MKIEIETTNNGWIVKYSDNSVYIYKSIDDFKMLEEVSKKFLKRAIKVEDK